MNTLATSFRIGLATAIVLLVGIQPSEAVVVPATTLNDTQPVDGQGWDYVGVCNSASCVYLGNGWVITTHHVGAGTVSGLNGGSYSVVPGTTQRLQNPAIGPNGETMTPDTDLVMFRIDGDPGLAPLSIISSTPSLGEVVSMIGHGRGAESATGDVPDQTAWDASWNEVTPPGNYRGIETLNGTRAIRWGNNVIADDAMFGEGADADHNYVGDSSPSGNFIALASDFTETGGELYEAQAQTGDSGGGVFRFNGSEWELVGLMHSVAGYSGQPTPADNAIFGNATLFTDLSYYGDQIEAIRAVPEPSTLAMLFVGGAVLLGTALRLRYRRAR